MPTAEYYKNHKREISKYNRQWVKDNPEKVKEKARRYYNKHKKKINIGKRDYNREYQRKWRKKNHKKYREYERRHGQELKEKIVKHYTKGKMECMCKRCHVKGIRALTVDHINGGGRRHQRSIGTLGGKDWYRWIINNKYPDFLQILCANCNFTKRQSWKQCYHYD